MLEKKEIKHIANLARIGISEEEIEKYQKDLSAVLDWVDQLEEVNIENIKPVDQITGLENIVREDKDSDHKQSKKITKLFPEKKEDYNKVKSVL